VAGQTLDNHLFSLAPWVPNVEWIGYANIECHRFDHIAA
jgi:hypothetical protein